MLDQDTITQQLDLLAAHLRTLAHLLQQAAQFGGEVFAPEQIVNHIAEARAEIYRIKKFLRENGIEVEDQPNDELSVSIRGGTVYGPVVGFNEGININVYNILPIVELCIDVAVPDKTAISEVFDLAVLVRPPNLPALQEEQLEKLKTGEATVFWPEDQSYVSLRVKVRAPDCTIHDTDSRSFRLYPKRASPILYFHLVPRKLGTIGIVVELYQEDDEIGSARVQTMALAQLVGEVKVDIVAQATAPQSAASYRFAATTDVADEDVGFKRLLLRERQRRLEKLELQRAREGHGTDPKILNEIEDLQDEIRELKQQLGQES